MQDPEVIRCADFSGGASEVLDPSKIPLNAAQVCSGIDIRTGIFSPENGVSYIEDIGTARYAQYIPATQGPVRITREEEFRSLLWGDYYLVSRCNDDDKTLDDYYENRNYNGMAARVSRYDNDTGVRSEVRNLGMPWVTEAENQGVTARRIRAGALVFNDNQHFIDGEIRTAIEQAFQDPTLRTITATIRRVRLVMAGADESASPNIGVGDWIALCPVGDSGQPDVLVARPGVVVEVEAASTINDNGTPIPAAFIQVAIWHQTPYGATPTTPIGNPVWEEGVTRSDNCWGNVGFAEAQVTQSSALVPRYSAVGVFKRDTKSLADMIAICRSICSRSDSNYTGIQMVSPDATTAYGHLAGLGAQVFRIPGGLVQPSGVEMVRITMTLNDYIVRELSEDRTMIVVDIATVSSDQTVELTGAAPFPLPYDLVCVQDVSNYNDRGVGILGSLTRTTAAQNVGLSPGVYQYAITRVDDWGREGAPWPFMMDSTKRIRVDASSDAEAESPMTALMVRISGFPQLSNPVYPPMTTWKMNIYRTRADGSEFYFHSQITSRDEIIDNTNDFDLSVIPMLAEQYYPPVMVPADEEGKVWKVGAPRYLTSYMGTLWAAFGSRLVFSLPGNHFAWPPLNFISLPGKITGIIAGPTLLVFTANTTTEIVGNTFSTMNVRQLSDSIGCVNHMTAKLVGGIPVWCSNLGIAAYSGGGEPEIVTEDLIDDTAQFASAVMAETFRGEYYLLLGPEARNAQRDQKARFAMGIRDITTLAPRYYLRFKPGKSIIYGGIRVQGVSSLVADVSSNQLQCLADGKLYSLFTGERSSGYWLSGELAPGSRALTKTWIRWTAAIREGEVVMRVFIDGVLKLTTTISPSNTGDRFPDGCAGKALVFELEGSGVIPELDFTYARESLK